MTTPRLASELPPSLKVLATKSGRQVSAIAAGFAPVIREYVEAQIKPLLERIAELEQRPTPQWRGVFKQGESYPPMSFAVDHGSVWISKCSTMARPGSDATWQLACKNGSHR